MVFLLFDHPLSLEYSVHGMRSINVKNESKIPSLKPKQFHKFIKITFVQFQIQNNLPTERKTKL